MSNALKDPSPEVRARVEEKLADGWPFKEIGATLGLSYYMLAKHWPGRAWTHRQVISHAITTKRSRP